MTAPADPGPGNRWADCGVCVEVPTVTGWALGRQDRCPVHGRQPFPDGEQSQFDDWRPPQEMVDDLVEAWHTQPDQLLDDFVRDLLRRWRAQGRLVPEPTEIRTEWGTRLAAVSGYEEEFSQSFEGAGSTEEERARRRAEVWGRRFGAEHVDVMRRTIWVGPWVPVPTTGES